MLLAKRLGRGPGMNLAYRRLLALFCGLVLQVAVCQAAPTGLLESDPATIFFNRGNIALEAGQFEAAVKEFDEAVKLRPDIAELIGSRGYAYYRLRKYDQSIADYNRAVELSPDYAGALYGRGMV